MPHLRTLPTALLLAVSFVAGALPTPAAGQADGSAEEAIDPRLEKAIQLLESRRSRALKQLDKLKADRPELEPDIACALAKSENQSGEYTQGLELARECAELASGPRLAALADAEILVATAGLGEHGEELESRLEVVRTFLESRLDDALTDRVRRRLCRARELLPDSHPSSLAKAALPDGGMKYLPKSDPEKGLVSVKPQLIYEREVNQRFEGVETLSGRVRASFNATIDADGCFANARLTNTTDEIFAAPALATVRGWVYRPPRLNDEPVAMPFNASVYMQVGGDRPPGL